jgi:hypothetical protein
MNFQAQAAKMRIQYGYININSLKKDQVEKMVGAIITKKALQEEITRQNKIYVNRSIRKHKTDILLINKANRLSKVKAKYKSYALFSGNYHDRDSGDMRYVASYDGKRRMALIKANGWCQYTRGYGTYINMCGLVLFDEDSQEYRFLRVGPNVTTINEALEYIKPADVRKAESQGKYVIRQGDVYFVPSKKWNMNNILGTNHKVEFSEDKKTCIIDHNTHNPVVLTSPHKAYRQMIVQNVGFRSGGGRVAGHAD